MSQATFGIDITASDKTAKGKKSAQKSLSEIPKGYGVLSRKAAEEGERSFRRSGRGIISTFSQIERASISAFGGGTGGVRGIVGGLSQLSRAGGTAAGSMSEAAAAGGVLEGALGAVAIGGAAVVGVIGGVVLATDKLAGSWAKGVVGAANLADTIGVATKALQEFQNAGERVGVDKGTAGGALAGLSSTLNDARYGRNNDAVALLARMGVGMKTKSDGTVDVEAMLPTIADSIARQNSSGRRTAARVLGIGDSALPLFAQGGAALGRDMADAGLHGNVSSDGAADKARKWLRKRTMIGQQIERGMDRTGEGAADLSQGVLDRAQKFGSNVIDTGGGNIVKSIEGFGSSVVQEFRPAVREFAQAVGLSGRSGSTLNLSGKDVVDLKKTVQTEWDGRSVMQGRGIVDTILNRDASGHWGRSVGSVVDSRSQFSNINGPVAWKEGRRSVDQFPASRVTARTSSMVDAWLAARAAGAPSSVGDNLNYANPNYSSRRNLPWINRLGGPTYGSGESIHRHGTTPELEKYRPGAYGVALPSPQPMPVKVEIHFSGNVPKGVGATVTAGHGAHPAISHALTDHH